MVDIPNRNVLASIAQGDQRFVRFLEDVAAAINADGIGAARPVAPFVGQQHYDTALGLPIWFNGSIWTDAQGLAV